MSLSPEFEALRLEIVAIKATLTIELENVRTLEALIQSRLSAEPRTITRQQPFHFSTGEYPKLRKRARLRRS